MVRVKMLKAVKGFNLSGVSKTDFLTANKGEVIELMDPYATRLIKFGIVELTKKAVTEEPEDSEDDSFGLTPDNKVFIRGLKKNDIESIMRLYGVEIDKRQILGSIHKTLIETVSQALPDDVEDNEGLAAFYSNVFEVQLDLVSYDDGDSTAMAESMGKILTEALEGEDS